MSVFAVQNISKMGQQKLAEKSEVFRTLTTAVVREFLGYGVGPTTMSLQTKIVDALRLGDRSKASNLLLDLGQGNNSLIADDFVYILNHCARSPDPLFVMETWRIMEEKKISLNNMCSLLMLKALCKGGYLDEAFGLINFLGVNHETYPALPMYNCFLRASASLQSSIHVNQCLDLMESNMVGKNEVTYSELLKLAVWQQNLTAAHEIWKDYVKNYSLGILPLRKFIWSFTRLGDLKSAYERLQQMVALTVSGNTFVQKSAGGKLYSTRLDIPIPSRSEYSDKLDLDDIGHFVPTASCKKLETHASDIQLNTIFDIKDADIVNGGPNSLNNNMNLASMKILRWSFSDVIHACASLKNSGLAKQLMQQMQNLGLQPSSHTFDGFLRAVLSERGFRDGMDVLKIMQKRNLKPFDSTLATLSIGCSKIQELDLAEALLEQVSHCPNPFPFNAFLAACDMMDQPERGIRILAKMKQLKLLPDIRTYELLFSLFGNVNVPYEEGNMLSRADAANRIRVIETEMARNGVQHSHLSMKILLKALGAEGMIKEMLEYLHVAESLFCRNNTYLGTPIYNTVLHSLVEAKESHMAIILFKDMKSSGFLPDAATYNIMIDCCSVLGCFRSASAILSMMVREGFCPQTLTYTALIKIVLEYESFDEALNLLDQASSEGNELDVLLFNTILEKACEKGRIEVVEFIVERMHRKNVQPDPSTCYYVFSAYVECGFHSTAMEALQVMSMRMLSRDGSVDVTDYEDLIFAEDREAESRILELFKGSNENLAVALLNFRWSTMVGFSISLSLDQSPWARRLSESYDDQTIVRDGC